MKSKNQNIIILFDGICNMCVWSVRFIISKDIDDIFRLTSIQSEIGKKIIIDHNIDITKNDSIILIKDEIIMYRSSAVLYILHKLILRVLLEVAHHLVLLIECQGL